MITRRSLLKSTLLASAALALSPRTALSAVDADEVFLNRLTFGANPAARADLARLGRDGWLDWQLSLPATPPDMVQRLTDYRLRINYEAGESEHGTWPALDELRPLMWRDPDPLAVLRLIDWETPQAWEERVRPANEVIATSLLRAVHSPAQLREVMTQFWHDHFNVHAHKSEVTAAHFPAYDKGLRDHALGSFRALLGHTAKSPAMLVYLNNEDSRASPANENYARELLELHTLGAPHYVNVSHPRWRDVPKDETGLATGYIDEDVYEVARAFTGWTIGDGRWVADGEFAPETGVFHYEDRWHDPYQKRILGRELPPNQGPMEDADQVLDILAAHPGTARFVCTKIARRLLADDPPAALVDRLADVFLAHDHAPDQIAQVIRALVAGPAFYAPPAKLRRPFEFLAALIRGTGAEIAPEATDYAWHLERAGWRQHSLPPPNGHSDTSADWANGKVLLSYVDWVLYHADDMMGLGGPALPDLMPHGGTIGEALSFWSGRLLGPGAATEHGDFLSALGLSPSDPITDDAEDRRTLTTIALAASALSPAFFYR